MAKIKKKGTTGQAKNFITRTQAVRKLQIQLPDFRRLCIFKGIYPREPRNKKKASKSSTQSTTFYYTKDIQYLLHEPLLNKFREHKALSKKIANSLGRGEVGDATRLEKNGMSKISLDHIIKERYPTFVDALRDLDDALSLLFLFANLPSTSTVPSKTIALCQRLTLEFQHYIITTNSLRKSFLSIKGIYYQATIQGQDILWLVPYKFVQRVTGDVDFRIMGTFVEFYTTLLGFVNFRLYTSIGLIYPPKFDLKSDEQGGELGAYTLEGKGIGLAEQLEAPARIHNGEPAVNEASELNKEAQKTIDTLTEIAEAETEPISVVHEALAENIDDAIDTFETTGEGADTLPQPQINSVEASQLFAPFTFFLSRETPRQSLEFILRAFGCKRVGWDAVLGDGAFTNNERDTTITHQVVDRPPLPPSSLPDPDTDENENTAITSRTLKPGNRVPGRTYIQPQWVWDCINEGKLLRPDLYAPGATLLPHLSPWVKPTKGGYDPRASLVDQEREGEAAEEEVEEEEAEGGDAEDDMPNDDSTSEQDTGLAPSSQTLLNDFDGSENGMEVANNNSDSEGASNSRPSPPRADEFSGFESDAYASPGEAETALTLHQAELEAEAAGLTFSEAAKSSAPLKGILKPQKKGDEARKRAAKKRREEEDELERRKGMMSRKKRKVLDKMLYSNKRGEEVAEGLRRKRRRIEAGRGM